MGKVKDIAVGVEVMQKQTTLAVTIQHMVMAKRNEDGLYIACDGKQQFTEVDLTDTDLNVTQVLVSRMSLTDGKMEHILVHHVDGEEAWDLIEVLTGQAETTIPGRMKDV